MAFTGSPSNRTLSYPELIHFSIACSAARLRAPLLNPKRLIAASRKRLSRSSLNCSLNPAKHLAKLQRYIWTYSSFPVTVGSARSDESSIRKKLGARRFEVNLLDDRIELIPNFLGLTLVGTSTILAPHLCASNTRLPHKQNPQSRISCASPSEGPETGSNVPAFHMRAYEPRYQSL